MKNYLAKILSLNEAEEEYVQDLCFKMEKIGLMNNIDSEDILYNLMDLEDPFLSTTPQKVIKCLLYRIANDMIGYLKQMVLEDDDIKNEDSLVCMEILDDLFVDNYIDGKKSMLRIYNGSIIAIDNKHMDVYFNDKVLFYNLFKYNYFVSNEEERVKCNGTFSNFNTKDYEKINIGDLVKNKITGYVYMVVGDIENELPIMLLNMKTGMLENCFDSTGKISEHYDLIR